MYSQCVEEFNMFYMVRFKTRVNKNCQATVFLNKISFTMSNTRNEAKKKKT